MFGNKNALLRNLTLYCAFTSKDLSQIIPPTFYLDKDQPQLLAAFEAVFNEKKKKGGRKKKFDFEERKKG